MSSEPIEIMDRVFEECVLGLQSLPLHLDREEAQRRAEEIAEEAFQRCKRISSDMFREGGGDGVLRDEQHDAQLHAELQKRLEEGVTDDDIRWWWNMCSFERQMLLLCDEQNIMAMFSFLTESRGYDEKRATVKIWKLHPKFGYKDDGRGEDRPLPFELKRRIWVYIENHHGTSDLLQEKMNGATSFNALVRKEIRAGNL
jgi:hypothetical protein